jgi:hypothetical protein
MRARRETKKDIPRIELGLLDSKSNVLTITPYVLAITQPPHSYFAYHTAAYFYERSHRTASSSVPCLHASIFNDDFEDMT